MTHLGSPGLLAIIDSLRAGDVRVRKIAAAALTDTLRKLQDIPLRSGGVSIAPLEIAASTRPCCEEVVFLGGAAIYLWITDPAAPATRATKDVDVISAVSTRPAYYALGERLRERGFSEASDSKVICRWNHKATGLILDVMPQDPTCSASQMSGTSMRSRRQLSVSSYRAPEFAQHAVRDRATKLAAWKGRGKGDLLRSLDVHDILILLDGRGELPDEIAVPNSRATELHPARACHAPQRPVLHLPHRKRSAL